MFFMMAVTDGRKDLDYTKTVICSMCGRYGRYNVFMTYTVLSLFFIPCFKWNKHYYVQMSCCGELYELDPEVGKAIAWGEHVEILQEHLTEIGKGESTHYHKYCEACGYETDEDFEYCPRCGKKLKN